MGHPVRVLKNNFSREFFRMEYDSSITNEQIEKFGAGALRMAAKEGDEKGGSFMAGQISGMLKEEKTARDIICDMVQQAETLLKGAARWVK